MAVCPAWRSNKTRESDKSDTMSCQIGLPVCTRIRSFTPPAESGACWRRVRSARMRGKAVISGIRPDGWRHWPTGRSSESGRGIPQVAVSVSGADGFAHPLREFRARTILQEGTNHVEVITNRTRTRAALCEGNVRRQAHGSLWGCHRWRRVQFAGHAYAATPATGGVEKPIEPGSFVVQRQMVSERYWILQKKARITN